MKLKSLSLIAGIISLSLAATPFLVKAQTTSNTSFKVAQEMPHQGKHHKFADALGLTDEQKQKLKEIHEDTKAQKDKILTQAQRDAFKTAMKNHLGRKAAFEAMNLSDQQKSDLKALMKSSRERMNAVLTTDQQAKLKELRQQWHSKHPKPNS